MSTVGPTNFTVSPVPTWLIFAPPSEFLRHLENFTPNPKNVRNTIIIANAKIFVVRKILPPEFITPAKEKITPSKNFLARVICVNFCLLGNLIFCQKVLLSKFLPQGRNFWIWQYIYYKVPSTVSLVPTWWFLPHLVSFYPTWRILPPILKCQKYDNRCKCKDFCGLKNLTPWIYYPAKEKITLFQKFV